MKSESSRRRFLTTAGLGLPVVGLASTTRPEALLSPAPLSAAETTPLTYGTLGKTGLRVTKMGFGCMITSDPSVIQKAADVGVTYFDTARRYQNGNNERMVGAALKGKPRKDLVVSTKTPSTTRDAALADLDTSLKELGMDYVDIWYLHNKTSASQITPELLEAQQIAKKQGKARFIGVSTHNGQADVIKGAIQNKMDVVLTSYNFTMGSNLDAAIEAAHNAGLGVVAMKVMAGGFRSLKPGTPDYQKLKREGAMLSALKWALRNKNVDTTIPSITDMEQLAEDLRVMAESFGPKDEQLLARQLEYIAPLYCRMCGNCSGTCEKGLPVSDVLRYLTYAEGYGQFALGRESFLELPASLASVRCADCETCSVVCPNGVKVAERCSRAQELFA